MNRFTYYWKRTQYKTTWKVAFRKRCSNTILSDLTSPFSIIEVNKKTWIADPFLFTYDGKDYLFTELYCEEKNKGSIAVSIESSNGFTLPQIVIDENIHLSFPCVFNISNEIYMIPETGQDKSLILYKAKEFPYKWEKVAILIKGIDSSDTIVWEEDNNIYVLASVLLGNARSAKNVLYLLDEEKLQLRSVKELKANGTYGIRNAGLLFCENGIYYRPGQNCDDGEYGKGLIIWKVNDITERYQEEVFKEVNPKDIKLYTECDYCGIHTYNLSGRYEVIDLKINKKNPFLIRIIQMLQITIGYFWHK